jgi:hypothetical protein
MATLYQECITAAEPDDGLPHVSCTVRTTVRGADPVGMATFDDAEPVDLADFILQVFPDRGYAERRPPVEGWRVLAPGHDGGESVAISRNQMLFRGRDAWKALIGSTAVGRLIRLQRGLLFFHAASIGVFGAGVMLVGHKGAGKTTVSLALAARGHAFLGDEIAGVRIGPLEMVPLRRSLAIRTGPRADEVSRALARTTAPVETYPDGSRRFRAQPNELFPAAKGVSLPLGAVVFLDGFAPTPLLEEFEPGLEHVSKLTPMAATLWGMPAARRAFGMLSLLARTRCYRMVLGAPEDSAARIERIMEG